MDIYDLGITGLDEIAAVGDPADGRFCVFYDVKRNKIWHREYRRSEECRCIWLPSCSDGDLLGPLCNIKVGDYAVLNPDTLPWDVMATYLLIARSMLPCFAGQIDNFAAALFGDDWKRAAPTPCRHDRPDNHDQDIAIMLDRLVSFIPSIASLPEYDALMAGVPLSDIVA